MPLKHWALAWWESWADPEHLEKAFSHRIKMPQKHSEQWTRVAGPTAALDLSLRRVEWTWVSANVFQDHEGAEWDCTRDPPAAIERQ